MHKSGKKLSDLIIKITWHAVRANITFAKQIGEMILIYREMQI